MSTKKEILLASYVALRVDGWESWTACPAWIESADRKCGRELIGGTLLCGRHHNVALKRQEKAVAKYRAHRERRAQLHAEKLPQWRKELAAVEAEIMQRDPVPIHDRAAVGGDTHPAIVRTQQRHLSDSNVRRMASLTRRYQELILLIGDAK